MHTVTQPSQGSPLSASSAAGPGAATSPRPPRLHSWFNLIPVAELEATRPERIVFMDTFVTVERAPTAHAGGYRVLLEGAREMASVVDVGVLFVWYGEHLDQPDRPFPTLFAQPFPTAYVSSAATHFQNTHVMDFVENGSDNLHFKAVHLWEHSRIFDHEIRPDRITLKQETRFRYGLCSKRRSVRLMAQLLPELELVQDYVYHGPGLAVVGAKGKGTPDMHALVSLTPEGTTGTRVYVTMALAPDTLPAWAESLSARVSRKRLCDRLAGVMANYIQNEFDVDADIWAHRKVLREPALLPSERQLRGVMRWGETFYPKDFVRVDAPLAPAPHEWMPFGPLRELSPTQLTRKAVAGRELVARLDPAGEARVYDAYCPHQGAHLGVGGVIEDGCLRCPFHGLYFTPEGQCLGPNPKNKTKVLPGVTLNVVEHRVAAGMLEVRLGGPQQPGRAEPD